MIAGGDVYFNHLLRQAETSAHHAEFRIAGANRIEDVVRAARGFRVPAQIRSLANRIRHRVRCVARDRIQSIVLEQLDELRAQSDCESAKRLAGRMRLQWQMLRGDFAENLRFAEREATVILAKWQRITEGDA